MKNSAKEIAVVAALLRTDKGVLIAKRATGNPDVLGMWEFPGGKVEPGESEQDAIIREIKEEFELQISAGNIVAETTIAYPQKRINLKLVECSIVSGEPNLHDHSDYALVNQDELNRYEFAPADKAFLRFV